jgi:hypothetical protein
MRIEIVPLILGGLLVLVSLGLIVDAWTPDHIVVNRERRRRPRIERHRGGEAAIGLGVACMAAAFFGRDSWRYSVLAVIAGTVVLVYGVVRNARFLGSMISDRGTLRRRPDVEQTTPVPPTAARHAERTEAAPRTRPPV